MGPVLPVVKLGVAVLAGIPVSKIVNDVIKNNVNVVTQVDKIKVATGSFVIGAMITQSLSKTTDNLVDSVVAITQRNKKVEDTEETEES